MIDKIFYFIMVPMVYLALVWCILGISGQGHRDYQSTKASAHAQDIP